MKIGQKLKPLTLSDLLVPQYIKPTYLSYTNIEWEFQTCNMPQP